MQRLLSKLTLVLALASLFAWSGQHSHAQSQQSKFSDFASQIPKQNTEVFAVNNIAGHVESFLRNEALKTVLEDGKIGEFYKRLGINIDMDEMLALFDANRKYYPETIAVTGEDEIYPAALDVIQLIIRINLLEATTHDNNYADSDLELLEKELTKIFQSFKLPAATIWIQWSDKEVVKNVFTQFQRQLSAVVSRTQLQFEDTDSSFQISGSVADITDKTLLNAIVVNMGLKDSDGDLVDAIAGLKIFLAAELVDGAIRVSLGPNTAENPRATAADMVGIKDGDGEIAYIRWNGTKMLEGAKTLEQDMARWADKSLGKMFIENDSQDVWGGLNNAISQFKLLPENGQIRAWAVDNQVRINIRQIGLPDVPSLVNDPILKMIPNDAESFMINNHRNFGKFIFDWVIYYEDRAAMKSLQKQVAGKKSEFDALENGLESYYFHFGPMRDTIRDELAKIESMPFTIIIDSKGKVDQLQIEFKKFKASLASDKFIRMVAISETKQTQLLESTITKIHRELVEGILSLEDIEASKKLKVSKSIDVAPGVTGTEFLFDWSDSDLTKVEIKGDFRPHVFVKDDFVVFSTSVDLSRQILAAEKPFKFDGVDKDVAVVDHGRFRGITMGNFYRSIFKIVGQVTNQKMPGIKANFDIFSDGVAELTAIMNHWDWTSTQQDSVRETLHIFDFKKN